MPILHMALSGLAGLGCANPLSASQIAALLTQQGAPPSQIQTLTAIALRESGGCADASNVRAPGTNGATDPGESSYGLFQINTLANPSMGSPNSLLDPTANVDAALALLGTNPANYAANESTAWYVGNPVYDAALAPFLQQAAGVVTDTGADASMVDTGGSATSDVAMAVAIGLGLWLLVRRFA